MSSNRLIYVDHFVQFQVRFQLKVASNQSTPDSGYFWWAYQSVVDGNSNQLIFQIEIRIQSSPEYHRCLIHVKEFAYVLNPFLFNLFNANQLTFKFKGFEWILFMVNSGSRPSHSKWKTNDDLWRIPLVTFFKYIFSVIFPSRYGMISGSLVRVKSKLTVHDEKI